MSIAPELEYHERLYSGFAQQHFAKSAVRALRANMVSRILRFSPNPGKVLSLGCGIGDTELILAAHSGEVAGIDLSPAAIRQAREDAKRAAILNVRFSSSSLETEAGPFDLVIAIFFLHHLPDETLRGIPAQTLRILKPGGCFYSLDPSRWRLSGAIGSLLFPRLMRRYQSPDERPLDPAKTTALFRAAGFDAKTDWYDFVSSPLAGLFPQWRAGYRAARRLDNWITRIPGVRNFGSNFEIIARKPPR